MTTIFRLASSSSPSLRHDATPHNFHIRKTSISNTFSFSSKNSLSFKRILTSGGSRRFIVAASPPTEDAVVATEPLTKQDLIDYLASGCKTKDKWRCVHLSLLPLVSYSNSFSDLRLLFYFLLVQYYSCMQIFFFFCSVFMNCWSEVYLILSCFYLQLRLQFSIIFMISLISCICHFIFV